jgi:hypothetical protein
MNEITLGHSQVGKALDFDSNIGGSSPSAPAILLMGHSSDGRAAD